MSYVEIIIWDITFEVEMFVGEKTKPPELLAEHLDTHVLFFILNV